MITTVTNQTISWFNKRNTEESLTLAPPFQRKPVWTEKQKSLLIDTILRELPVPEIYIQRKTSSDGETEYVVVDGQQRIRSILEFINGDFALFEDEGQENVRNWAGLKFDDLNDDLKKALWDYNLAVRELPNVSDQEVRDIFRRLNVNLVPLNNQELRNARYNGPFITLMTKLAENDFWAENRIVTATQIRRMVDIEYISELFVAMMHGVQDGKKMLDDYYRQYEIDFPQERYWRGIFSKTISTIEEILPDLSVMRWRRKPDFYGLFCAISHKLEKQIIPADKYEELDEKLTSFGIMVDEATASKDRNGFSEEVKNYYWAIERATGNKERRAMRETVILQLVTPYLIEKRSRLIKRRQTKI